MHKLRNKITKPLRWITQGGNFNIDYTSKVEIVFSKLYMQRKVWCENPMWMNRRAIIGTIL